MTAYYNEIDPFAAAWLRELIAAGQIAPGIVDERDIRDIRPDELAEFTQCHFFAGIGVWSHALRQAGWPDDRPVWTGSCPCQPFSAIGRRKGIADERHLWPHWFYLIGIGKPVTIFGEQVASKDGLAWFDTVSTDLEEANYAVGVVDLCAASVGAPELGQRLYYMGQAKREGLQGFAGHGINGNEPRRVTPQTNGSITAPGPVNGFWSDAEWRPCVDGKRRAVQPGSFPLAYGITNRMGKLRGYGNALNAPQAQAFIEAAMQA